VSRSGHSASSDGGSPAVGSSTGHETDPPNVRSAHDLDQLIGFLGFWALVLLVTTVWMEVTTQPALGWALGLLASLLALWGLIRMRRRLPARTGRRVH
jgi:cytosine/uracil/thiamine/allantoin permease